MRILLTGGAGFVGSHLIPHLLTNPDVEIYSLERQSRAPMSRVQYLWHDFTAPIPDRLLDDVDYIIHNGAEVQGRGSVENPEFFVRANVLGTFNVLEAARTLKPKKVLYVSSAEAVGAAPEGVSWDETATLRPSNPYAASKAASEMLCRTYFHSFGVPVSIVRTMNVFGSHQRTDKFVPMLIKKLTENQPVTLHEGLCGQYGSRQYLSVREFVRALSHLLDNGTAGEVYHVVGQELDNLRMATLLASALQCSYQLQFVVPGSGHDLRYSVADTKLGESVYCHNTTIADLNQTVLWYQENPEWLR